MIEVFGHPFSSYTWKALIAFRESGIAFEFRLIDAGHPANVARLNEISPLGKFPAIVDGDVALFEATIIIEHLRQRYPEAAALIPAAPRSATDVRMLDRFFDNYVMTPMQAVVFEALRPADARDPFGVAKARKDLDTIYAWLDAKLDGREWAAGSAFTLADCAAAPSLFYADWTQPIPAGYARLKAYRARLLARPEFARIVDEARPYRNLFPLGAPDRD